MVKIAVISDVHLKSQDNASDFYLDDYQFYLKLKDIRSKCDILIINGDFLELWQIRSLSVKGSLDEIRKIIRDYPKSMGLIMADTKIKITSGNHDDFLSNHKNILSGKVEREIRITNNLGQTIVISHGIYDFFNSKLPNVIARCSWLIGWIERIFQLGKFNFNLGEFLRQLFLINLFVFRNKQQLKKAKEQIRNSKKDLIKCVVNGHTHKKQLVRFRIKNQDRYYVNTGFFNGKTMDVVYIDIDRWEVEFE